ncbi:hypothetical protein LTR53_001085 [Teratosphaeriaceae sp. CCFEE 6253]|nr:hypothetical protein LTR53_001085 [Teratosphaeriaceae sp. CCFEE 6253]
MLGAKCVSVDLVLICILLMVHFEALRESFVPALVHVENAIRLLHESAAFDARKADPQLVRALMRLDLQGSYYLGARIPGLPFYTAAVDSTLPSNLHDVSQARDVLNVWTCRMIHFTRTHADEYKLGEPRTAPLEIIARSQVLAQIFADLDRLLFDFMQKPSTRLSLREQHGLDVLRMRTKCNRIIAACCCYAEESSYDAYTEDFDEILSICSHIMRNDTADRRLITVSVDDGLLHPLQFTASQCRDSRIRRSALAHLKRLPKQEGVWHVEAMTRTAQMCVDLEETWCGIPEPSCKDVQEWQRIHLFGFDGWDLQRVRSTVTAYFRIRPNGPDGGWTDIRREIAWSTNVPSGMSELSDAMHLLSNVERDRLERHNSLDFTTDRSCSALDGFASTGQSSESSR